MALMAVIAGVRANICTMELPILSFVVFAAIQLMLVMASEPHASEFQTESKPRDSASSTRSISTFAVAPMGPANRPSRIYRFRGGEGGAPPGVDSQSRY